MIKGPNIRAVYKSCFTRLFRKTDDHEGPTLYLKERFSKINEHEELIINSSKWMPIYVKCSK